MNNTSITLCGFSGKSVYVKPFYGGSSLTFSLVNSLHDGTYPTRHWGSPKVEETGRKTLVITGKHESLSVFLSRKDITDRPHRR